MKDSASARGQGKVPVTTLHKILRKRIYTGEFDYGGIRYQGAISH